MHGNITFTMIKPDAVKAGNSGLILDQILKNGFQIKAMRLVHLTKHQAEEFYAIHSERPFYKDLVEFMSSGPVVAAILEKTNAVEAYRVLIGATNPEQASEGTIRKRFATSIQQNAVHGSDADETAIQESNFFFSFFDRV
ncbi:MAG: nucleoside-diphosphate kinase [Bacteroidetes bacterium]|nr:nucleoside-diphosphate kinase [Bacteroidota bacterium]